jgi:hypothetical protein
MYMANLYQTFEKQKALKVDYKESLLPSNERNSFIDVEKQLTDFLNPLDTDDANEGTFIVSNNTQAIQFADAATNVAYFKLKSSPDLIIISLRFIWSTPATSGNLYWQVDIGEGGNLEANNERTTGGTAVATATTTTANDLNYTEILNQGAVYLSQIKQTNLWGIKFSRLGAHANDTLSDVVNLYGLEARYK